MIQLSHTRTLSSDAETPRNRLPVSAIRSHLNHTPVESKNGAALPFRTACPDTRYRINATARWSPASLTIGVPGSSFACVPRCRPSHAAAVGAETRLRDLAGAWA